MHDIACDVGSCLEEDVGRVEVTMADAHAVDVRHALSDVEQNRQHSAPVQRRLVAVKVRIADRIAEAAAIAKFLRWCAVRCC